MLDRMSKTVGSPDPSHAQV